MQANKQLADVAYEVVFFRIRLSREVYAMQALLHTATKHALGGP